MSIPMATIQADFDRLALLSEEGWNHNEHYCSFLLRQVPVACREALEIGNMASTTGTSPWRRSAKCVPGCCPAPTCAGTFCGGILSSGASQLDLLQEDIR